MARSLAEMGTCPPCSPHMPPASSCSTSRRAGLSGWWAGIGSLRRTAKESASLGQHVPWGPREGNGMARRFHYRRLQHTFAVAAAVGADWQVTEEPGEGIEVGCFAGLAELNGTSGDLRTDMA